MDEETIVLPIDGVLDLHAFRPGDTENVTRDYLTACLEAGVLSVRIVHGKGKGVKRRIVHRVLASLPFVSSYSLADEQAGSWGATVATLAGGEK
ncbi:MAG: Smr/MutS family protein [Thermodesulfobacteriota bacterium]